MIYLREVSFQAGYSTSTQAYSMNYYLLLLPWGVCIWMILSYAVASFADKIGQSFIIYFLLSLFFTPLVGFLVVKSVKTNTKIMEMRLMETKVWKRCTDCYEIVKSQALVCKHCGNKMG